MFENPAHIPDFPPSDYHPIQYLERFLSRQSLLIDENVATQLSQACSTLRQWITSIPVPRNLSHELFNILELSGAPSNKPRVNVGVPVLLIRNLDIPRLRNGTRLQITHLGRNDVKATVMTDIGRRESVLIPHLPIIPKDLSSQFKM
ncbi:hypothetical protein AVEN_65743-1 [Araneus ventricosus]|uniref:DNA helicase Pif1-like 2B domain-containing protein n=1 Tax=Araneus ventricosus TaxID=182803 RepID=A0A4Y2W8V2_ARAVE|nr:hypothetical protein AVEN_65743-1 [Araneus ventricosus]